MPRVGRQSLPLYSSLVRSHIIRNILRMFLLVCLAATGSFTAHAQCYEPWASANNVFGTIVLQGNYNDAFHTINQHASMGLVLAVAAPCAEWFEASATPFGVMVDSASVHETEVFPNGCNPGTLTNTWAADGAGSGQNSASLFFLGNGFEFQSSTDTVNGTFSQTGPCMNSTMHEAVTWGPQDGILFTGALPGTAAVLSGDSSFSANDFISGIPITWNVTWSFSPAPDGDCKPCKDNRGSELSLQSQSLGEDIPIVGTPFYLHYESGRAPGHAGADAVSVLDAHSLGGWTLNVHHALEPLLLAWCAGGLCTPYATMPKALFLGDGSSRNDSDVQSTVAFNGNLYLTSEDGTEVYVFTHYVHVQTLRPMTGAVLYSFGYDANGHLISITDNAGNVTQILRAVNENPTTIVSPFGQATHLSVDVNGYLSQITDPAGHITKLSNGSTGLLASLTDPNGHTFKFQYDTYGRVLNDSDPAGGSLTLTRTNSTTGYSVSEKTALGVSSKYALAFSSVAGISTMQQFTNTWPNGLKATETDTQALGQLSSTRTLPDGTSYRSISSPDPRWGIQAPIDASSKITFGNLTMNTTYTRAATVGTAGNPFSLTTQTDTDTINGRKYTSAFTSSNRTYVDRTPVGRKATTVLDSLERISSVQLGTLLPAQLAYDARGRLSTITQGTRKTTLSYTVAGFLASVTDPIGLTRNFTYDADGHVLKKILADGRVITVTYDSNGNLSTLIPPGKTTHTFAYNTVNSPSTYTPPPLTGAGSTSYTYDKDRHLTLITRPDAKTITFKYDTAGRLSSVIASTETVNYAYNATTGNLASASIPSGESIAYGFNGPLLTSSTWTGTVAGSVSRTFNNNFWVTSLSLNGANTSNFTYDNDGLVTKAGAMTITEDPNNGLITGTTLGNVTDTRTYNTFGELTGYAAKYKTTTLYAVTYIRDADGRVASKAETINGKTTTYVYTYDKAGRLTGVTQNGTTVSTYIYDTNSNRMMANTSSGKATGMYDGQDRLLTYGTSLFTYTANGELASQKSGTQTTTYTYDVLGNLTSVTLPNATKLTYLVDPENHRVAKQVNGTQQTGYLYDGDLIVAQLNASNQIVRRFVYVTGATSPDYMVNGGATYRIIADQLGSPRLVVNTATGGVAEQMNYDEFGNVLQDSDAGFQPFGFAGGLKDPDTGFVRFGARDYDPSVGRWTAKDPIRFNGGNSNLYGYVLDDPVNLRDPNGRDGIGWWVGASGEAGIGAGASIQGSAGGGLYWGGKCGVNTGSWVAGGGFLGWGKNALAFVSAVTNQVWGVSAGVGLGAYFTNATSTEELEGPFDVTNVGIGPFSFQWATSGETREFSLGTTKSTGLSASRYRTTTLKVKSTACPCEPMGDFYPILGF